MICTLDEIRSIITPIAQKYNLSAVYLFGSYARGTAREDSDLDLLVDLSGQTDLLQTFTLLYDDLTEAFRKPIDLVTMGAILQASKMPSEDSFKKTVLEEKVSLYEACNLD